MVQLKQMKRETIKKKHRLGNQTEQENYYSLEDNEKVKLQEKRIQKKKKNTKKMGSCHQSMMDSFSTANEKAEDKPIDLMMIMAASENLNNVRE